jgi:hypothetical protein
MDSVCTKKNENKNKTKAEMKAPHATKTSYSFNYTADYILIDWTSLLQTKPLTQIRDDSITHLRLQIFAATWLLSPSAIFKLKTGRKKAGNENSFRK